MQSAKTENHPLSYLRFLGDARTTEATNNTTSDLLHIVIAQGDFRFFNNFFYLYYFFFALNIFVLLIIEFHDCILQKFFLSYAYYITAFVTKQSQMKGEIRIG